MNSQEVDIIEEEDPTEMGKGKKRKPRRTSISIKDVPRPFYHIKDPMDREQFVAPLPSLIKNTSFDYVIKPPPSGLKAPPPSKASTMAGTPTSSGVLTLQSGLIKALGEALGESQKLKEAEQSSKELELIENIKRKEDLIRGIEQKLEQAKLGKNTQGKPYTSKARQQNSIQDFESFITKSNTLLQKYRDELNKLQAIVEEEGEEGEEEVEGEVYIPYVAQKL